MSQSNFVQLLRSLKSEDEIATRPFWMPLDYREIFDNPEDPKLGDRVLTEWVPTAGNHQYLKRWQSILSMCLPLDRGYKLDTVSTFTSLTKYSDHRSLHNVENDDMKMFQDSKLYREFCYIEVKKEYFTLEDDLEVANTMARSVGGTFRRQFYFLGPTPTYVTNKETVKSMFKAFMLEPVYKYIDELCNFTLTLSYRPCRLKLYPCRVAPDMIVRCGVNLLVANFKIPTSTLDRDTITVLVYDCIAANTPFGLVTSYEEMVLIEILPNTEQYAEDICGVELKIRKVTVRDAVLTMNAALAGIIIRAYCVLVIDKVNPKMMLYSVMRRCRMNEKQKKLRRKRDFEWLVRRSQETLGDMSHIRVTQYEKISRPQGNDRRPGQVFRIQSEFGPAILKVYDPSKFKPTDFASEVNFLTRMDLAMHLIEKEIRAFRMLKNCSSVPKLYKTGFVRMRGACGPFLMMEDIVGTTWPIFPHHFDKVIESYMDILAKGVVYGNFSADSIRIRDGKAVFFDFSRSETFDSPNYEGARNLDFEGARWSLSQDQVKLMKKRYEEVKASVNDKSGRCIEHK